MFSPKIPPNRRLIHRFLAFPAPQRGKYPSFLCSKRRNRRRRTFPGIPCLGLYGKPLPALGGRKGGRFFMGGLFSILSKGKEAFLRPFSSRYGVERLEALEFEECEGGAVRLRNRCSADKDKVFGSTNSGYEVINVDDDDDDDGSSGLSEVGCVRRADDRKPNLGVVEFPEESSERERCEFRTRNSQEVLLELLSPIAIEDEKEVNHVLRGGNNREVLVTHQASNIQITRKTLQCLNQKKWLNDEVINLYFELLKEREKREPNRFLKCHFFNTFFFTKLTGGKAGYDYEAVRRWTATKKLGYCLIECDKIFVPIHKRFHWCLAVIDIKEQTFQYLDSLGGFDKSVLDTLVRYFRDEVEDKNGKVADATTWKIKSADRLPLQQNGWDCGMFMLKYCDFYSRGLDLSFGQEHMKNFRKRTVKEIVRLRAE